MKVSKRQLLRIIREEAEAAAEEETETSGDGAEESSEESETTTEAALRRKVRAALMKESRHGLFGAIGFAGLGQTNGRDPAAGWGREHAKQVRRDSMAARGVRSKTQVIVKEDAGGDPKRVLYDTVIPALEDAGFTGLEAFKMLRKCANQMEDDFRAMFGPAGE